MTKNSIAKPSRLKSHIDMDSLNGKKKVFLLFFNDFLYKTSSFLAPIGIDFHGRSIENRRRSLFAQLMDQRTVR